MLAESSYASRALLRRSGGVIALGSVSHIVGAGVGWGISGHTPLFAFTHFLSRRPMGLSSLSTLLATRGKDHRVLERLLKKAWEFNRGE